MTSAPSPDSQHVFKDGLFAGTVALVTGGGSGIGLECARQLVRLGASVAICGRTVDKLDKAKAELEGVRDAARVFAAPCDIRDGEACESFVASSREALGEIDVLINNAGGQFPAPAMHISPGGFAAVVNNNLNGTFNMTRAVANASMIPDARGGRIINVIANIYRGFPGMVHTGAARAGVENMTMTLAVEWARFGVLINAVAPGIIRSSGTERYPKQLLESAIQSAPLGRAGTVDEVAAAILFLACPAAQFITGATVRIDGAHSLYGDVLGIKHTESKG